MPLTFPGRFLDLALASAPFVCSACLAADNIIQSSEVSQARSGKIEAVLMVGTSGLNTNDVLGNKQAIIGGEVRKLLKGAAIQVFPMGIGPKETDPANAVAVAIAKNKPSHVMRITVPRGEIYVKTITGESVSAKGYVVQSEVLEVKTNTVVWRYTANVSAGLLGASNLEVAEALVATLRSDGLL